MFYLCRPMARLGLLGLTYRGDGRIERVWG
ncbi:hypothetical protein BRC2024_HCTLARHO_CDS_0069 [Acinetobacter phage vB_AbaS_Silvergun]